MTNSKDSDERSHRLIWVCAVCKMLFSNARSHKCIGFFASKKVYFNVLGSYAKQITFQSIKIQSKRLNVAFLNVSAISF